MAYRARYGAHHRKLRARIAACLAEFGELPCARCGAPIRYGEPWHLGHRDGGGPRDYSGPEHPTCNQGAPMREGGRHLAQVRAQQGSRARGPARAQQVDPPAQGATWC